MRAILLLAVALALAAMPRAVCAQYPIPPGSILAGVTQFDLPPNRKGTAPFGSVRMELPILFLVAEGSVGAFEFHPPNEKPRIYVVDEVQLQYQFLPIIIKPYFGAGVGRFMAVAGEAPRRQDFSASASGGVRIGLPLVGAVLRGELRVRYVGAEFIGSTAEWTAGISW